MNSREKQNLKSWALDFGIHLSDHQINLLSIYLDELWDWNKKTNLTGLSSRRNIIRELMLDSLIPSAFLPTQGRFLDVGSGAGFPGIPLMICNPALTAHFLEPNSKKTSFLKQVLRLTDLHQVVVFRGRIEKSKDLLHPQGYHAITARALAPLPKILKWCAPHLLPSGLIINFQGDQYSKALEESSKVMKHHNLVLTRTIPYALPKKRLQRNILLLKKVTAPHTDAG